MRTDEELVVEIRRGEPGAFDELYRRYERRLFGYIRRMVQDRDLAEDLFQEVVLIVLCDRSVDLAEGKFAAWIFTVARNRCLTHLRQSDRRAEKLREWATRGPEIPPARSPEEIAVRRDELATLRTALEALSPAHQDALLLKEMGRLTYREIAEIQEVPEGTAKSRLHHAIKSIRRILGGCQGETP
jgi:RNA polymerase sigma-70 factor (ECF subfamily)